MLDFSSVLPLIQVHANAGAPRESCGVVVKKSDGSLLYVPCRNQADGRDVFRLDPQDAANAEDQGELVAYAHSHVYTPATPTDADRAGMARTGLPWIIVNYPTGAFTINDPVPFVAPLEGRNFVHGVHDCYAIVRDYYATRLGITLADYPRVWGWWENFDLPDMYRENFAREGFVSVHEGALDTEALRKLRPHDLILFRIRAPRDNHAGIYTGENFMIHHLIDELSRRELLGEFYQKRARAILRHRSLMEGG
ncbi:C40 family peptidase [Paraburkholderia sp. MM5384-R2]|uniref:C40 family peptidase n=1 Tax=Paraburkholderia sp. MM5384-R2 TaxID=2723097 RepID=UPI0016122494|nr:C40 family peptidase [Paraburkholderia sp. MM5384-R2]MBB5496888.1 proteasome lid subunit RPN8/RPN11 [Paraburkholderia sp. MM5384-R2]